MTREAAKKLVDVLIYKLMLQRILNHDVESLGRVDALCFAFSMSSMARVFPKADLGNKDFEIASATQGAILARAIDDGALSKQYIYDRYVDLVQEANEENSK